MGALLDIGSEIDDFEALSGGKDKQTILLSICKSVFLGILLTN